MGTNYYVNDGTGNDGNTGLSAGQAWKTLTKASTSAAAGSSGNKNIINVAPGTYAKQSIEPKNYQTWQISAAGNVILEGNYSESVRRSDGSMPSPDSNANFYQRPMVNLQNCTGSDVSGAADRRFVARNSAGLPVVFVSANSCDLRYATATFCYDGVVNADRCNGLLLENNIFEWGDQKDYDNGGTGAGAAGVQVNVLFKRCGTITFRNNILRNCRGEGVGWANDSGLNKPWGMRCYGNVIYNLLHMHIVINHGHQFDAWGNFLFHTNDPRFRQANSGDPPAGIMISDENGRDADGYKRATTCRFWNNIILGFSDGLNIRASKASTSAARAMYFGFNLIANCKTNSPNTNNTFGITIPEVVDSTDPHYGSLVEHNIIINSKSNKCSTRGIAYRKNLTFNSPNFPGSNGNFIADPKLVNNNYVPTGIGDGITYSVNPTKYLSNSPAINAALARAAVNGMTGPIEAYTEDYSGLTRNNPDLGPHEFNGVVTDSVTAVPSANVTSVQTGTAVNFSSAGSIETGNADINQWLWNWGDLTATSSAANPSHAFAAAGVYTVTLTVYDTVRSLQNTATIQITVTAAPPTASVTAAFTATPQNGVKPLAVNFNSSGSSVTGAAVIDRWEWMFGALGSSTQQNPSFIFNVPGEHVVSLTVRDSTRGLSNTTTKTITVGSIEASFTQSDNGEEAPHTVVFTNTSAASFGVVIDGYEWEIVGGEAFATTEDASYEFTDPGVYQVVLTVTDSVKGVSHSYTGPPITITQTTTGGTPEANLTAAPVTGAPGVRVQFTDLSSNAASWFWSFGDGEFSTDQSPVHTYREAGTYKVSLRVGNGLGDEDTLEVEDYITVISDARRVLTGQLTPVSVSRYSTNRTGMDDRVAGYGEESHAADVTDGWPLPIRDEAPEADLVNAIFWVDEATKKVMFILPDETIYEIAVTAV